MALSDRWMFSNRPSSAAVSCFSFFYEVVLVFRSFGRYLAGGKTGKQIEVGKQIEILRQQ